MIWQSKSPRDQGNPYQNEWNDLVDAIRNDKPYNEAERGVEASLVTSLGRKAAHTGPGDHARRHAQLRARVRAGRGQVHDGFARRRSRPTPTASTRSQCRASSRIASTNRLSGDRAARWLDGGLPRNSCCVFEHKRPLSGGDGGRFAFGDGGLLAMPWVAIAAFAVLSELGSFFDHGPGQLNGVL